MWYNTIWYNNYGNMTHKFDYFMSIDRKRVLIPSLRLVVTHENWSCTSPAYKHKIWDLAFIYFHFLYKLSIQIQVLTAQDAFLSQNTTLVYSFSFQFIGVAQVHIAYFYQFLIWRTSWAFQVYSSQDTLHLIWSQAFNRSTLTQNSLLMARGCNHLIY